MKEQPIDIVRQKALTLVDDFVVELFFDGIWIVEGVTKRQATIYDAAFIADVLASG